jgi:hypothetical protein
MIIGWYGKMKKTVLTILCAAMAVATLAGCTTNSSGDKNPSDISANNDARIVVPTQGSDEVPADDQTVDATVPEESQADLPGGQNQSGFADDQLLTWASTYYEFAKGEKAPNIEIDHVEGETVYIHIFSKDDTDPEKKTTLEMYAIDRKTGEGKNFAGETVDLTTFYKRTTGEEGVD